MQKKTERETIQANRNNKCVICGKTEKKVGTLEKVHIKEHSRVRFLMLPMCANHHKMYNKDQLSNKELKKIDLILKTSEKSKSPKKTNTITWDTLFHKIGIS